MLFPFDDAVDFQFLLYHNAGFGATGRTSSFGQMQVNEVCRFGDDV
ncbi:MAG: hypothetical protein GX897_01195 [Clostridiales bacterium]|nr:hypothetical protein [Clostridiales bacterium]